MNRANVLNLIDAVAANMEIDDYATGSGKTAISELRERIKNLLDARNQPSVYSWLQSGVTDLDRVIACSESYQLWANDPNCIPTPELYWGILSDEGYRLNVINEGAWNYARQMSKGSEAARAEIYDKVIREYHISMIGYAQAYGEVI